MVDCGSIALCIVIFRDLERANNKTNEKNCEKSLVDLKCPTRFLKQTTKMWKKWGMGQILLEWFSKYIKQKKGRNVGELSNYVGMNFLAKQTTKMW